MNRDNYYYNQFIKSLRPDQLKDYNSYSLNNQKDWYIRYLEDHYFSNIFKKRTMQWWMSLPLSKQKALAIKYIPDAKLIEFTSSNIEYIYNKVNLK